MFAIIHMASMLKFLLVLSVLCLPICSLAQTYKWVNSHDRIEILCTVIGRDGSVFAGGNFSGSVTLGATTHTAAGQNDIILIKYDPSGQVVWSYASGGTGHESAQSLAVDSNDNISVLGWYQARGGTNKIGSYTLPNRQSSNFVMRLSAGGQLQWCNWPTGSTVFATTPYYRWMIANEDGSIIYITSIDKTSSIGPFTFTAPVSNMSALVLAKQDLEGQVLWAKLIGYNDTMYPIGLTKDVQGHLYVGCSAFRDWQFQTMKFFTGDSSDIVVLKLDSVGTLINSVKIGSTGRERLLGFGVDDAENIYLTGYYTSNLQLGDNILPTASGASQFIARVDPDRQVRWVKSIGSGSVQNVNGGVAVDRYGNTTMSTSFFGDLQLPDTTISSKGMMDVVFMSFDDQGKRRWLSHAGALNSEETFSVISDGLGSLAFCGRYNTSSQFGQFALNSAATSAGIVGKITEPVILTTSPILTEYCPGDSIIISFKTTIPHTLGNQFFAYLSDSVGKFDKPVEIGKINGRKDSVIRARLPVSLPPSTRYRVRVSSTMPAQEGLDRGPYFTVHPKPAPKIEARKSVDFCEGEKVPLTASGGKSYRWSTGDTTANVEIGVPGWHYVTVANEFGCESTDSIKLISHPYPVASVTASGPVSFCQGGQVTLTAKGGKTYVWSTGEKTSTITVKTSGEYYVNVEGDGDCTDESDRITVIVHPLPAKPVITQADGILTSSSEDGNEWYMAGGSRVDTARSFMPAKSGKYYVRVTDSNGCIAQSDFIDIEVEQNSVALPRISVFEVSPNPVIDQLEVRLSSLSDIEIEIVDVLGAVMMSHHIAAGQTEPVSLSLKELSYGAYYVIARSQGETMTRKIVKH